MKKLISIIILSILCSIGFSQKSTGIKFNSVKTINVIPAKQTLTDTANYKIIMDDENARLLIVMVWVGGTKPSSFDLVVWKGADYVDINDRIRNELNAAVKSKILAR